LVTEIDADQDNQTPSRLRDAEELARAGNWDEALRDGSMLVGVVSYYVCCRQLLLLLERGKGPGAVAGFYLVILVGGWIRARLSKPDEYFSLRDR